MRRGPKRIYKTEEERSLAKIYSNMVARCKNPKVNGYKYYGGKGIKVCDVWANNKLRFIAWGISSGYRLGLSIDRKDTDSGYSPNNCQWVTKAANNGRHTRHNWSRMKKTSVNLPSELSERIKQLAKKDGCSSTNQIIKTLIVMGIEAYNSLNH